MLKFLNWTLRKKVLSEFVCAIELYCVVKKLVCQRALNIILITELCCLLFHTIQPFKRRKQRRLIQIIKELKIFMFMFLTGNKCQLSEDAWGAGGHCQIVLWSERSLDKGVKVGPPDTEFLSIKLLLAKAGGEGREWSGFCNLIALGCK